MAILQAILVLIGKSAGKILTAVFGWAVRALFGQTSPRESVYLSALVGAAVAWPILLLGIAFPKVAALLLAFVPIPRAVPPWSVRVVWLALALVVPLAVGLMVAHRAAAGSPRESFLRRTLRGVPITVGLAGAFLVMFVSVPIMRFAALVRRQKSASIPLITAADDHYRVVAFTVVTLNRHGFGMCDAEPGWWVRAPMRLLAALGGDAFRGYVSPSLAHYESSEDSPELAISFYTSGILLRGTSAKTTWAHGLIEEAITHSEGLQTSAPEAQAIEKQLRRLWKKLDEDPFRRVRSPEFIASVEPIARSLGKLDVAFEEWQLLYRQVLQLDRAVRGEPQLLDAEASAAADDRDGDGRSNGADSGPSYLADFNDEDDRTQVSAPAA